MIRHSITDLSVLKNTIMNKSRAEKTLNYQVCNGVTVKNYSHRYVLFQIQSDCVCCGLKGSFLALEKSRQDDKYYHFNLYGVDDNENEVIFTKDHIIPRTHGGNNKLSNYQTLCYNCNQQKTNLIQIKVDEFYYWCKVVTINKGDYYITLDKKLKLSKKTSKQQFKIIFTTNTDLKFKDYYWEWKKLKL